MDGNNIIELIFVIFTGLSFGSFVTLASYRLPLDEDIVVKPSRCPICNTPLGFKDLWPVLSWAIAKGKCRYCAAQVSIRYPLTEVLTAVVFMLIYLQYGLNPLSIVLALFAVSLLVMIVADLEHYIIPDQVHVALLILALCYHYVVGSGVPDVLSGLTAGLTIGLSLHHGYRALRKKEGLGFGDVKFMAVAGLWLGFKALVPFLFYSGVFGVLMGLLWRLLGKGPIFPFGPALAAALFTGVVYPEGFNIFWNIGLFLR